MSYAESLADQFIWANQAIARVRELHKNVNGACQVCCECGSYCDFAEYPCETIKALDGEQG